MARNIDDGFMYDPEARSAEELRRSRKKLSARKTRNRETSISADRFSTIMTLLGVGVGLICLAFAAFLVYKGVSSFIG